MAEQSGMYSLQAEIGHLAQTFGRIDALVAQMEQRRIERVKALHLAEATLDSCFDDAISLAAQITAKPMASINILDDTKQWIKNPLGAVFPPWTPRSEAACNIAISQPDPLLVIADTKLDSRIAAFTWVKNSEIRFYAGAQLKTTDNLAMGTLCVYDAVKPGELDIGQREALIKLARIVSKMLETRTGVT